MLEQLKKLVKDEEAPTAVEYALMVACIAAVIITSAFLLGQNTSSRLGTMATSVQNAGTGSH
jgi:pilus assembly protein Flp/PilA